MKIMVVGGGGREHTIIKKLKENKSITEIFALPGNGGIAKDATCVNIAATDLDGIVAFAKENAIEYAVVAPTEPAPIIVERKPSVVRLHLNLNISAP